MRRAQELDNPTHRIFAIEEAGGLEELDAAVIAGILGPLPLKSGEVAGKYRTRLARQALRRIDARITYLEALEEGLPDREAYLRNRRAVNELRWCRGLIANGGIEPEEWFEDWGSEEAGAGG